MVRGSGVTGRATIGLGPTRIEKERGTYTVVMKEVMAFCLCEEERGFESTCGDQRGFRSGQDSIEISGASGKRGV